GSRRLLRSRRERLRQRSPPALLNRATAQDYTDELKRQGGGNEDEPSDRLSERARERWHREREVSRDRRHDEREEDDLRTETRGTGAQFLVEPLLERHAVGDGRDQDPGTVIWQPRRDPDRDRFQNHARARIHGTLGRCLERLIERSAEIKRADSLGKGTSRQPIQSRGVARPPKCLRKRGTGSQRRFRCAQQMRRRKSRTPPNGPGSRPEEHGRSEGAGSEEGEQRQRCRKGQDSTGQDAAGPQGFPLPERPPPVDVVEGLYIWMRDARAECGVPACE